MCKTALSGIAETPSPASAKRWSLILRGHGIFMGIALVIVALLLVFLFTKSPGPPQLMVMPPPQAPADLKQTPAAPSKPPAATAPSAPAAQEPTALSEPTAASSPQVTAPKPSQLMYVVNIHYLAVRNDPSLSATQITTLNFHDEVELLETSGGWGRVRDVRRNIVGWSSMRYLVAGRD
jgi:hypothetical protein